MTSSYPTTNKETELPAINQILSSVGQAPVTTLDQTNPDVAIAYDTLLQVSKEVQAEGWTFNTEFELEIQTDGNKEYIIPNNMLQVDLSPSNAGNIDVVRRTKPGETEPKLYDRYNHKWEIGDVANDTWKVDVVYWYNWVDIPQPVQNYIVSKASTITAQRIVGDGGLIQMLQQREALARANAMEYECNQGDYSFFGRSQNGNHYSSYKPYTALQR